jgi:hypothetical protein
MEYRFVTKEEFKSTTYFDPDLNETKPLAYFWGDIPTFVFGKKVPKRVYETAVSCGHTREVDIKADLLKLNPDLRTKDIEYTSLSFYYIPEMFVVIPTESVAIEIVL